MKLLLSSRSNSDSFFKQSVYILLLPLFFLLHCYNELFGFIPFSYMLLFYVCAIVFAGMVLGMAWFVTRSLVKSLFITFCCLVLALFWGAWHDFIKSFARDTLGRYSILLPVTIVLIFLFTRYFVKRPEKLVKLSKYLRLLLVFLCFFEVFSLLMNYHQFRNDNNQIYPFRPINEAYSSCNQPDSLKPDIYFIIFDEYTNNRSLRELWGFDNSSVTDWLSTKGFFIPDSSKANYSFTPYSLSTTFNMNYIPVRKGKVNDLPHYILKALKSLSYNETFDLLQKEQYQMRVFTPFKSPYQQADIVHELDHFAGKKLYYHTLFGRFIIDVGWHFKPVDKSIYTNNNPITKWQERAEDMELITKRIKSTANDSANRPPQFVYGHLMTTHIPHIYDEAGKVRTVADGASGKTHFDTYINQVKMANKSIQDIVDHVLSHNRKNTVIILMGDHGYRRLPDELSRHFFSIFSAFYFPDRNYPATLSNISAVNTFRIVFNQYFCQNLSLLKDSSIIVKY